MTAERETEFWTGALQRAEIVFLVRADNAAKTMSFLTKFRTAPVTREIVDAAASLFRRWNPAHGTGIHDAILAATVAHTGGRLFTQNLKHFPMRDIVVTKGW